MICRCIAFNTSKVVRTLAPFSSVLFTKPSFSVAKLDDDDILSTPNFTSDCLYHEILFGMKKKGFRAYLHGHRFQGLVSDLRQSHVEEIMGELMSESSDLSVWFYKELRDAYGFLHSRFSTLLVSHILADQRRFKELQVILEQLLKEEGSGSSSLLCELLSISFSKWDSTEVVWDMLLFISSRSKMVDDSLYILEKMKDFNLNVSTNSYNSILYNSRETNKMWDVLREINAKNDHTYSIVVDGLCRQQKVEDAVLFFRNSEWKDIGPSVSSFNSIMSAYCKLGSVDIAKSLLCTVLKSGLVPSVYSHNILINGLCLVGSIDEALELADGMSKHGVEPDTVTYNILAKCFHHLGMISWVWEVIQQMLDKGLSPDVITYMIVLCGHCQLGNIEKGFRLLKEMLSKGFELNSVIPCSVMLSGLCKTGRINEALSLFCDMRANGIRADLVAYSIVIHGLCRLGEFDMAVWLYNEMCSKRIVPNSRTHGAMLLGLCQKGMLLEARTVLNSLISNGCAIDIILYNIVIDGYAKFGCIDEALELFRLVIDSGLTPTLATFNSLIHGYCKNRNITEARKILDGIESYGLVPGVVSYTTLMNAYANCGNTNRIDELRREMKAKGISPTKVTYTVIIKGLCRGLKHDKCDQVIKDMDSQGISVDHITYNTIIQCLCRVKDFSKAFKYFEEMRSRNLEPTPATYNILIDALCFYDLKKAEKFLYKLQDEDVCLSKVAYTTLIKAHCVRGDPAMAVKLFHQMVDRGFDVTIGDYSAAINRLCRKHLAEETKSLVRLMLSRGVLPDLDIWRVMNKSSSGAFASWLTKSCLLPESFVNS
ncbi:unnamed protein product [Cochlearia groenlandica]